MVPIFKVLAVAILFVNVYAARPALPILVPKTRESQFHPLKLLQREFQPLKILERMPRAIGITTQVAIQSFLSTAGSTLPLTIIMGLGSYKEGIKVVLKKGAVMSCEWGQISAIFTGAEYFLATIRDKDDRWNAYIGSGIGTASLGYKEGLPGMVKGFIGGVAFLYMFDVVIASSHIVNALSNATCILLRRYSKQTKRKMETRFLQS